MRLGYSYLSLKNAKWDEDSNIFPDLFRFATGRINPGVDAADIDRLLADVKLLLDNEDLGKAFYDRLFLQIQNNLQQNMKLAQLRDWLLPLLMNGQVTVA